MIKFLGLLSLVLAFAACTNKSTPDFQKTVVVNKKAKTYLEWEASDENPRNIFKKYREEYKTNSELPKQVCESLLKLDGPGLSLFEEEINFYENAALVKECRETLKRTLEEYWQVQKKSIEDSTLNFKFQTRTQKRDLSKGYRAKTGDVAPKELILSFDDGPDPTYTNRILDILSIVDAKAMFFLMGPKVLTSPEIVRRAAQDGHIMGSHTMSHHCQANNAICARANGGVAMTHEQAIADIRGGHQAIFDVLGFVDPFFRFPYGESDPSLVEYLASKQVAQVHWTIESEDWKARPNDELLASILSQVDKVQKGIILFHDSQRRTLEILPEFLKTIYGLGYNLVILQSANDLARYNSLLVTNGPRLPYYPKYEPDGY